MLRKFAVGLAAFGALNAAQVKALGLGEVTVHSALNQPLDAEIELLQLRDLASSQIISGLADADEFYLAGVKPTPALSDIRFQLEVRDGKGKIHLSTRNPIREPFLNFLVEVNWPTGRLVREYTLLLDPPVFSAKDLAPRPMPQAPMTSGSQPMPAPMPAMAVAKPAAGPGMGERTTGASQYSVGKKDTLWNIALKTRPDRTVSPQQMMLAIQKTNPSAFVDNNINRLKSGVVLNIPNKQQILALDFADSVSEVKRQNSAWRSEAETGKTATKPEGERLDAGKTKAADSGAGAAKEEDAQLRIVSAPAKAEQPEEPGKAVSAEVPVEAAATEELRAKNQELEEQLVVTLEGLDKVERDNEELFQRLDKLGQQMESLQHLVELKDRQLAELQSQLNTPAAPPPPPPKSAVPGWLTSPAVLGGAGAAVLALVGGLLFFLRKKKQDGEQAVNEAMAILDAQEGEAEAPAAVAAVVEAVEPETEAEAVPEEVVVEEDLNDPFNLASDDDLVGELDSFGDEALEMDLKIDEPVEEDAEMEEFAESLLSDDEYDIAVDEPESAPEAVALDDDIPDVEVDTQAGEPDDLDFILGEAEPESLETEPEEAAAPEAAPRFDEEDDLLGDLDSILGESVAQTGGDAEVEPDAEIEAAMQETSDEVEVSGLDTLEPLAEEEEEFLGDEMLDDLLNKAEASEVEGEASTLTEVDLEAADQAFGEAPAEEEAHSMALDEELGLELDADREAPAADAEIDEIDRLLAETATEAELEAGDEPEAGFDVETLGEAEAEAEPAGLELADDESVAETDDDIEAIMADLGVDEIGDIQDADVSIAEEVAESEADLDSIMAEMEQGAAEDDEAPEFSGLALETEEAPAEGDAAEGASALVLDEDLDAAGDEELEAELNLMLEEEDNALSLEETGAEAGEVDYLDGADEVGTKLDLARAYLDMDDQDGARDILQEVLAEGSDQQKAEAQELLKSIS